MMAVLAGVCAAAFALSTLLVLYSAWSAATANSVDEAADYAYVVLAIPFAIAAGVLGVLFWWFS